MGDLGLSPKQNVDTHLQHGYAHYTSILNTNTEIDRSGEPKNIFYACVFFLWRLLGSWVLKLLCCVQQCQRQRCSASSFAWFVFVFLTPERMFVHIVSPRVTDLPAEYGCM
jgi:hypothetical protein